jgi:outer membrane protein OmpA-like peptidoglycan-associated protein
VKNWLIERGISPDKIELTIGYGSRRNAVQEPDPKSAEAKKMDPAALEAIRKQNRRIAVRVAKTCD